SKRAARVVRGPASTQRQEHFLRQIIDLGRRRAEPAQRPIDVVELLLERRQARLVGGRSRSRRWKETQVAHDNLIVDCPAEAVLSEIRCRDIDPDQGAYAWRRPAGDVVQ